MITENKPITLMSLLPEAFRMQEMIINLCKSRARYFIALFLEYFLLINTFYLTLCYLAAFKIVRSKDKNYKYYDKLFGNVINFISQKNNLLLSEKSNVFPPLLLFMHIRIFVRLVSRSKCHSVLS